jgi:hypothetical protein
VFNLCCYDLHRGPCSRWHILPLSWVNVSAAVAMTGLRPRRGNTRDAVRRGPADCAMCFTEIVLL